MKKYLALFIAAAICASCATPNKNPQTAEPPKTENPVLKSNATKEVTDALEHKHYNTHVIDKDISVKFLDSYLNALDPEHLYLFQSDISDFDIYRTRLDDYLHKGNSDASVTIFKRYQQRASARLNSIIATIPEATKSMRFDGNDFLDLDRGAKSPWLKDVSDGDSIWRPRLKNEVLSLLLSGKNKQEATTLLVQRYQIQLQRLEQTNIDDVYAIYINALLATYDDHSNYFPPSIANDINGNTALKSVGIGLVLKVEGDYVTVVRAVPAGPAAKQGNLKPGDRIIAVGEGSTGDMRDVVNWQVESVVNLLRGPRNSAVRLDILPAESEFFGEHKLINLVRDQVKLEDQIAHKKIFDVEQFGKANRISIITIPTFYIDFDAMRRGDKDYQSVTRDVQKLIAESMSEGAQGIVLDLRDNGGGSLKEASDLCALFIEQGPTVQLRTSDRKIITEGKSRPGPYYDGPLILLINRLSASGTEIFVGALQDYQRALVVGSKSFGTGTVQQMLRLSYGDLKLTQAEAFRISGKGIQLQGVTPDIAFPSLFDETKVGEETKINPILADRISPLPHRIYFKITSSLPQLSAKHRQRTSEDKNFQPTKTPPLSNQNSSHLISLNESVRKNQIENHSSRTTSDIKSSSAGAESDPFLSEAVKILIDAQPTFSTSIQEPNK